jgi:hypothetical protein
MSELIAATLDVRHCKLPCNQVQATSALRTSFCSMRDGFRRSQVSTKPGASSDYPAYLCVDKPPDLIQS